MYKRKIRHMSGWQKPILNSFLARAVKAPGIGMLASANNPIYYRTFEVESTPFVKEAEPSSIGLPSNVVDTGPVLEIPSVVHASKTTSADTTKKEKVAEQSGSGASHDQAKLQIAGMIVNESKESSSSSRKQRSPTGDSPKNKKKKTSFRFE